MSKSILLLVIGASVGWIVGILGTAMATATLAILSSTLAIGAGLTAAPQFRTMATGSQAGAFTDYALLATLLLGLSSGLTGGTAAKNKGWLGLKSQCQSVDTKSTTAPAAAGPL
jgi:hypothetical protein